MNDAPASKMADLKTRVISALILALGVLLVSWWGGLPFSLVWGAAAIIVMIEFFKMVGTFDRWIALAGGTALGVLAMLAPYVMGPSHFSITMSVFPVLFATLGLGVAAMLLLARRGKRLWAVAGFLYASVLAFTPPFLRADPFEGLFIILAIYGLVWGTDIGAYFFGRLIGGPKLWPRVSPKKTWSGLLGGMLCGVLLAWIFMYAHDLLFAVPDLPKPAWGWRVQISIFLAVTAALTQLGDLMESAWKRRFDIKDASSLIPGHGGLMDRLDGFWAACIVMLLAYAAAYGFA
ncbi:MAG: phosphatidate cytidylyltransferase [Beijerinckiaceae bacterium]